MKIKSNVDVSYNNGLISATQGKLTGVINSVAFVSDFNALDVVYSYLDENEVVVYQGHFSLFDGDIDAMSASLATALPSNYSELPERDRLRYKYYLGFASEMAKAFNLSLSDLVIVL